MKTVILAGGLGTRIGEESQIKPKPMIEIGGRPIIWHIMKLYSSYGFHDFIICLGYKGYLLKEYFANYFLHMSDVTFDLSKNEMQIHQNNVEPWKVTLVDTGEFSMTGGRLKRIKNYLDSDDFCLTYGDGLSNINIAQLVKYHKAKQTYATVTAVQPPARFGAIKLEKNKVIEFLEKPQENSGWINGGFFVLSPKVIDYVTGDDTIWEREPMEQLAREKQLSAFLHHGFWQPMDTQRDKKQLELLWESKKAPWAIWQ